jgi:hypothetical protein
MDDWPSIEQMIEDVIKTDQWTLQRGFLPYGRSPTIPMTSTPNSSK